MRSWLFFFLVAVPHGVGAQLHHGRNHRMVAFPAGCEAPIYTVGLDLEAHHARLTDVDELLSRMLVPLDSVLMLAGAVVDLPQEQRSWLRSRKRCCRREARMQQVIDGKNANIICLEAAAMCRLEELLRRYDEAVDSIEKRP
ncbi:MAG: hypothetical protein WAT74_02675 [Flavobacteriales bacterium]